jgi:hypothetical protein
MPRAAFAYALALSIVAMPACAGPPVDDVIDIYIPEYARAPAETLMEGCRFWEQFGMTCRRAEYPYEADFGVAFHLGPCGAVLADWDTDILTINVNVACYHDKEGNLLTDHLRSVFAHEVGHAVGVEHVPLHCDLQGYVEERDKYDADLRILRHPDGRVICGPAVMNPASPVSFHALTEMDVRAFHFRDKGGAAAAPSCRYPSY